MSTKVHTNAESVRSLTNKTNIRGLFKAQSNIYDGAFLRK